MRLTPEASVALAAVPRSAPHAALDTSPVLTPRLVSRLYALSVLAILASLATAAALPAQQLRTLSKADAEFDEPFTQITGVRELRDGRVIVNDVRDKVIQLIDFKSGTAKAIGREGSGPKEFGLPMGLIALPGDTSAIFDPLNSRSMLILPNGEPGEFITTSPPPAPAGDGARRMTVSLTPPRYTDSKGRIYYVGPNVRFNGQGQGPDSQPILRFERGAKDADTVGFIRIPASNTQTVSGGANRTTVRMGVANPFEPRDEWVVTPDGRVAVIRSPEYRVDWTAPTKSTGAAIAYNKVKVTEGHKKQWRDSRSQATAIFRRVGPGGASTTSGSGATMNIPEPTDWPEEMPPFLNNGALVAPNGQIWVLRTRDANDNVPKYDVIDTSGKVVSRVALAPRSRVVGFGNGVVYVMRMDEDDLQYLQRFRL